MVESEAYLAADLRHPEPYWNPPAGARAHGIL